MKLRAGFTCDSTADWITGGREGGAALSIALSAAVIGRRGRLYLQRSGDWKVKRW